MSLKNAFRARFRNTEKDKCEEKDEDGSLVYSSSSRKGLYIRSGKMISSKEEEEMFEAIPTEDSQSLTSSPGSPEPLPHNFHNGDERNIYELQLAQLQEQMVAIMIENQSLFNELQEYKDQSQLDKLRQELEYERGRNQLLEEKCVSADKRRKKVQRSKSDASRHLSTDSGDLMDAAKDEDESPDEVIEVKPVGKQSRWEKIWDAVMWKLHEFVHDFTDVPEPLPVENTEGDPLAVKKLKNNITRFGSAAKPYVNTLRGIHNLVSWKSPSYTLFVFTVYMYSSWNGLLLPVILFLVLFRLFINYMKHKGWNLNVYYLDPGEEEKESEDKDKGVSDRFNVVLQVARKVQNTLGFCADSLEKIKSLLTWCHPPATKRLFLILMIGFIVSCFFQASFLFYIGSIFIGIKFFIIDYIFDSFPRIRQKYDSTHQLWQELPTDAEYEKKNIRCEIDKHILPLSQFEHKPNFDQLADNMTEDDKSFCELFSLPLSESPLPGWQGGRRCALINKDKPLTAAFKNGKLYLTRSFLCFERTKSVSTKNLVLPLSDLSKIERAKPYQWLPGGGMAIEVTMMKSDKTHIFGPMIGRNELFDSILYAGRKGTLPWADDYEHANE